MNDKGFNIGDTVEVTKEYWHPDYGIYMPSKLSGEIVASLGATYTVRLRDGSLIAAIERNIKLLCPIIV